MHNVLSAGLSNSLWIKFVMWQLICVIPCRQLCAERARTHTLVQSTLEYWCIRLGTQSADVPFTAHHGSLCNSHDLSMQTCYQMSDIHQQQNCIRADLHIPKQIIMHVVPLAISLVYPPPSTITLTHQTSLSWACPTHCMETSTISSGWVMPTTTHGDTICMVCHECIGIWT